MQFCVPMSRDRRQKRQKPGSSARVSARADWFAVAILLALTLLAYLPVLWGQFTNWDDNINVTENPFFHPLTGDNLAFLFTHRFLNLYVPLTYSSWAFDLTIGGGSPFPFHFDNLLLHCISVALVYVIVRRLLAASSAKASSRMLTIAAFCGAALFAIHPLQVETVAWITARKDILSGLVALVATWQFLRFRESADSAPDLWRYGIACVCFAASLLAKPGTVTLPIALFALDWWLRPNRLRSAAEYLLPWLAVAVVFSLITTRAQKMPQYLLDTMPLWKRPFIASDAVAFYTGKLLIPLRLSAVYGKTPARVLANWWAYASLPVVLAALVLIWRAGRLWFACTAFALALLFPVLGFVPYIYQNFSTAADHYMYLPMLGAAMALAFALLRISTRWPARGHLLRIVVGVLIAIWATLSFTYCFKWQTSRAIWENAARIAPHMPEVHQNLGQVYLSEGQRDEGMRELQLSVQMDPDFGEAHNNLGLQFLNHLADPARAAVQFEEAVRAYRKLGFNDSRQMEALNNLAVAYMRLSRYDDAERALRDAIQITPMSYRPHSNLAQVLEKKGERAAAESEALTALQLNPEDPTAKSVLQQLGR